MQGGEIARDTVCEGTEEPPSHLPLCAGPPLTRIGNVTLPKALIEYSADWSGEAAGGGRGLCGGKCGGVHTCITLPKALIEYSANWSGERGGRGA